MRFTVSWLRSAETELTALWLESEDRSALTTAANEIDRLLRTCPLEVGESREKNRRMLLVRPLGVQYSVSEDDRVVRVLHVWRYRVAGSG
jgi:hypothetical protein